MASEQQQQHTRIRSSSPHLSNSKLSAARRPKLMRAAVTAPYLQTSVTPKEAQYSQSSTTAAVLLARMFTAGANSRPIRGGSIGSLESTCSSPEDNQIPTTCREVVPDRKDNCESHSTHSVHYFSFPNFEDFKGYQELEGRS